MLALPLLLLSCVLVGGGLATTPETLGNYTEPLAIVTLRLDYVKQPLVICTFLLFTAVFMIAYHHTGIVRKFVPETCVLVVVGFAFAAMFKATNVLSGFKLEGSEFMIFLLPPIVADASYQLHSNAFVSNVGTILLYAVVGTLLNLFFIGGCLYGLSAGGVMGAADFTPIDSFLFASLIVAVDPVAVIAIFKAVGVNEQLYFLVFGESLFNDAVTIVVFELMDSFTFSESITPAEIGIAVGAFIVHSCGAALIGFLVAILSAFVTKFTKEMPIVQPVTVYIFAYWSYLLCELFGWSGIIGLAVCCLTQTQFTFQNLTENSYITLTTGASVIGTIVEACVFFLMGAEMFVTPQEWNGLFIMWVMILCLIGRLISVFGLNAVARPFRKNKIGKKEQFIMWWAGLRGALAFALASTLNVYYRYRQLFITTTIIYIIFTIFFMGITMRPLVRWLNIEMKGDFPEVIVNSGKVEPVQENIDIADEMVESKTSKQNTITSLLVLTGNKMKRSLSSSKTLKERSIEPIQSDPGVLDTNISIVEEDEDEPLAINFGNTSQSTEDMKGKDEETPLGITGSNSQTTTTRQEATTSKFVAPEKY